jgi:hypothetical protein
MLPYMPGGNKHQVRSIVPPSSTPPFRTLATYIGRRAREGLI